MLTRGDDKKYKIYCGVDRSSEKIENLENILRVGKNVWYIIDDSGWVLTASRKTAVICHGTKSFYTPSEPEIKKELLP